MGDSWPPLGGLSQLAEAPAERPTWDLSVVLNSGSNAAAVPTWSSPCGGAQRGLAVCLGLHSSVEARHWDWLAGYWRMGQDSGLRLPQEGLRKGQVPRILSHTYTLSLRAQTVSRRQGLPSVPYMLHDLDSFPSCKMGINQHVPHRVTVRIE